MLHSLSSGKSIHMIISQQMVQEINSFWCSKLLVLRQNELVPWPPGILPQKTIVLVVELNLVLGEIGIELIRAENLGNLD